MEKKFDQSAMRRWCEKKMLKGASVFRDTKSIQMQLGMIDKIELIAADFYSLGFVAAFGYAMSMFEEGEERESFETALYIEATFKPAFKEMMKDED